MLLPSCCRAEARSAACDRGAVNATGDQLHASRRLRRPSQQSLFGESPSYRFTLCTGEGCQPRHRPCRFCIALCIGPGHQIGHEPATAGASRSGTCITWGSAMNSLAIASIASVCTFGAVQIGIVLHAGPQLPARVPAARRCARGSAVLLSRRPVDVRRVGRAISTRACRYRTGGSMNASNYCSAIRAPRAYNRNAPSTKACHE